MATIDVEPDDQLDFFTDGLLENTEPRRTTDDLVELLRSSRCASVAETADYVMDHYDAGVARPHLDDVAVMVIKIS